MNRGTNYPFLNRRNSEARALREVREQLKKDLLRYQGNQVRYIEVAGYKIGL